MLSPAVIAVTFDLEGEPMSNQHAPSHWQKSRVSLSNEIIQEASAKQFTHPSEAMEAFADEQSSAEAKEMFVRMLMLCIPTRAHGVDRKKVGHKRMCVLTYMFAPKFFDGMTKRELAAYLGITYRALKQEFKSIKAQLTTTNKTK